MEKGEVKSSGETLRNPLWTFELVWTFEPVWTFELTSLPCSRYLSAFWSDKLELTGRHKRVYELILCGLGLQGVGLKKNLGVLCDTFKELWNLFELLNFFFSLVLASSPPVKPVHLASYRLCRSLCLVRTQQVCVMIVACYNEERAIWTSIQWL